MGTASTRNPILYGKDNEEGIVGIAPLDDKRVTLWLRDGNDYVESRNERVYPFMYASDIGLAKLDELVGATKYHVHHMEGDNQLKHLLVFDNVSLYKSATKASYEHKFREEVFSYPDICTQYLIQSGKTMFKGMTPDTIHRLQLDIETYKHGGFPNAERDPIIIISLCDNRGYEKVLHVPNSRIQNTKEHWTECATEADMLMELVKEIHRRDPDTIELHNGFSFDLPYIQTRCKLLDVNFAIGRDSKRPRTWPAEKKFAERDISYINFTAGGRSILDTMFLAIDWDVYARQLPGVGLKVVAKHFGVAPENRTYIPGDEIAKYWDDDPESLLNYALDDVYETRGIGKYLCPSIFYLTEMMPMPYQQVHLRGKAAVIQSLFIREYVKQREPLPIPLKGGSYKGGYTDIFQTGVFKHLLYADVASLYPSIMLNYGVQPATDTLEIFQFLLQQVTDKRFEAKAEMNSYSEDQPEYGYFKAKQEAFKIIINSFYGALGAGHKFRFSDESMADLVTRTGRSLLQRMMEIIVEFGGDIVEVDTDGVLFVRPKEGLGSTKETHLDLIKAISEKMPTGINVDLDGYFPKMLSLMKKNYALLKESGEIKLKGGSLKSRGMEPLFREYTTGMIRLLLNEDVQGIHELHERYKRVIMDRDHPIEALSKTATLKKSLKQYQKSVDGGGNRMAQYEIALRRVEAGKPTDKGDRITYVICGDVAQSKVKGFRDAVELTELNGALPNVAWYLGKRLRAVTKKYERLFTKDDFKLVFNPKLPDSTGELFELSTKVDAEIQNVRLKACEFR